MLEVNGKCLCELCFSALPDKSKVCKFCDNTANSEKYPTSLVEGTILAGRYAVGRVLGKGGFGITYLCYDLKENKKVAVKEYLPDALAHRNSGESRVTGFSDDKDESFKDGAKKFYDEARLISKFNGNPNVINVSEFFFENNTAYFVMEYLDGMDFKMYISSKEGKIEEAEAVYITEKILEALTIVHSVDVLHRDISPDNIFLCADGSVKLIDFGAARQVVSEASNSLSIILKQGFAPFEQYQRKGKQGPWTDIYALGATLYFSVTGKIIDDAMSRLDDDTVDYEGIDENLAGIIRKMLAVRTPERYQNVFEVKEAFSKLEITPTPPIIESGEVKNFCPGCKKEIPTNKVLCDECYKNKKLRKEVLSKLRSREQTVKMKTGEGAKNEKRLPKLPIIASAAAILVIGFAVLFFTMSKSPDSKSASSNQITVTKEMKELQRDIEIGTSLVVGDLFEEKNLELYIEFSDENTVCEIVSQGADMKKEYPYKGDVQIKGIEPGKTNVIIKGYSPKTKNTFEAKLSLNVILTEAERQALESGVASLRASLDGAKVKYDAILQDTGVDHSALAESETAAKTAIDTFEAQIGAVNREAQLAEVSAYYEQSVAPAISGLEQLYNEAVSAKNGAKNNNNSNNSNKNNSNNNNSNKNNSNNNSNNSKSGTSDSNNSGGGSSPAPQPAPQPEPQPQQPAQQPESATCSRCGSKYHTTAEHGDGVLDAPNL